MRSAFAWRLAPAVSRWCGALREAWRGWSGLARASVSSSRCWRCSRCAPRRDGRHRDRQLAVYRPNIDPVALLAIAARDRRRRHRRRLRAGAPGRADEIRSWRCATSSLLGVAGPELRERGHAAVLSTAVFPKNRCVQSVGVLALNSWRPASRTEPIFDIATDAITVSCSPHSHHRSRGAEHSRGRSGRDESRVFRP